MEDPLYLLLLLLIGTPKLDTSRVYQQPAVVVTATRIPLARADAPSRVSSLDVSDLRADGFRSVGSMLSTVGGLFVKDYGPAQLQSISLRGTSAEQTLFILDGVSLNNIQNGEVDLFLVPANDISSIEVSQGNASALYGANAVGGVVSFRTGIPRDNLVRVDLGMGSYGSQSYGGEISEGMGDVRIDLNLQRRRAINNYGFSFQDSSGNTPMQRVGADYLMDNQSLKISLPSRAGSSSLLIQNVDANRGTPGMVTDPSFLGTAREIDNSTIAILKNAGTAGVFEYSASAGAIYSYLRYIEPSYGLDDYYKTLSFQPAVQLSYSGSPVSAVAGIDGEIDRGESDQMTGVKSRNRVGGFISTMFHDRSGMDLETRAFVALRFDAYSEFGNSINPKIGLNVKPFSKLPLHLRASFGTAFRVPTFNDLYYAGAGNTSLKPEKSVECDFGGVFDLPTGLIPTAAALDFSYYHINIRDGIIWRPVNTYLWLPENYDKILSTGVEVGLRLNVNPLFSLRGSYTFGKSLDVSDAADPTTYNKQQIYIPEGQSSLVATVSPWILNFTAVVTYAGTRYYTTDNSLSLPPYTLASLSAGARVTMGSIEVMPVLSVNDLFNKKYEIIDQYPMPSRTYQLDVSFQFNQDEPK